MQLAAAMLIVLVSLPAAAQQQREKVMIWGAGLTSCGEFLKIVEDNPRSEVTFGQWLHGYISGRNYADRGVVDYAAGLERAALMAWITNHCKNNLLDSFLDATEALIRELQARGRIERR